MSMPSDFKPGFRLYRPLVKGEFIIVFGDCSQGGSDSNFHQYGSKTRSDIPLVFQMQGVAAEATPFLMEGLRWVYRQTGVKPLVCLERNNGGGSEMHHLVKFNTGEWSIYYMKDDKGMPTDKPGWDTTGGAGGYRSGSGSGTRPTMLGEWLIAYESHSIRIYDQITQEQHQTFIVNKNGKPEAAPGTHDDGVMSCAGWYQLYQTENPSIAHRPQREVKRQRFHV